MTRRFINSTQRSWGLFEIRRERIEGGCGHSREIHSTETETAYTETWEDESREIHYRITHEGHSHDHEGCHTHRDHSHSHESTQASGASLSSGEIAASSIQSSPAPGASAAPKVARSKAGNVAEKVGKGILGFVEDVIKRDEEEQESPLPVAFNQALKE